MEITEEQKQKYIEELRNQVENHPKSYASYINQTGGCRHWRPDRQYLRDFIKEQTPLLCNEKFKLATKLYWILNGITSWEDPRVRCEQCGKPFDDRNVENVLIGYVRFCSRKCHYSSEVVQQKIRETCMKKYGVTNAYNIPYVVERVKSHKDEIQKKRDETKRRNRTFNTSNVEQKVEEYLKTLYPDLIVQYNTDKRYPFNCDFYSPSEDLFMEFNGLWTHGGRFYDPNDDFCVHQLEGWKEKVKTSNFFVNAIETWTVRDVSKKKFAEENHLNYKVFWNINEVMAFLNEHGITIDYQTKRGRNPVSSELASKMYEQYGKESFQQYKTWEFPYPTITDNQIKWEIEALKTKEVSDKQYSPMIRRYHLSMWNCRKENQLSPIDYWEKFKGTSEERWRKFYINRLQHAGLGSCQNGILKPNAIRSGFAVLRDCNPVSYLKPFLAKRLINTYLQEFPSIFCPMNGFSGFMLGAAVGCGRQYIGQDLNAVQLNYSVTKDDQDSNSF